MGMGVVIKMSTSFISLKHGMPMGARRRTRSPLSNTALRIEV
jgi:hypothetical protein